MFYQIKNTKPFDLVFLGRSKWQLPTGIFLYSLRSYKVVFYQTKNLVHLNEVYLVEASGLARGALPRPPAIGNDNRVVTDTHSGIDRGDGFE